MKIYFSGVGAAQHVQRIADHPVCPRVDDQVEFRVDDEDVEVFSVRSIYHAPDHGEYDLRVIVGAPIRRD